MATKQTAVEWLEEQLVINGSGAIQTFPELFEQAKQMHKEQIAQSWHNGDDHEFSKSQSGEDYYNETYGK